jgi:hypothetical protein
MANPSKRKGTSWEVEVRDHFHANGYPQVERLAQGGVKDRADLWGIVGMVIGCKNRREITLAEFMDEIQVQKANAGASIGVEIIKRRNKPVGKAYLVMEFDDLFLLLSD